MTCKGGGTFARAMTCPCTIGLKDHGIKCVGRPEATFPQLSSRVGAVAHKLQRRRLLAMQGGPFGGGGDHAHCVGCMQGAKFGAPPRIQDSSCAQASRHASEAFGCGLSPPLCSTAIRGVSPELHPPPKMASPLVSFQAITMPRLHCFAPAQFLQVPHHPGCNVKS